MKVQKGGLIVLFLSIFMFIRCDHFPLVEPNDNYDFITFRNNSDDTLSLYINYDYPDTVLRKYLDVGSGLPHQETNVRTSASREHLFKNYRVVQIFVYKTKDVMFFYKTHNLNEPLGGNHLELKRYELTKDWSEEHNWTITYP